MTLNENLQPNYGLKGSILDFLKEYQSKFGYDDGELSKILGHKKNVIRRIKTEENYFGSEQLFTHLKHFFQLECLKKGIQSAEKPFVEVTPEITKTGNWRIVYPRPEVVTALRWALAHGSVLPLDQKRKTRAQRRLAAHLGWPKWVQDITRRSAASYWLALTNDLKLMVEQLGNSEAIFKRHYKKPVPHEQAVKFFETLRLVPALKQTARRDGGQNPGRVASASTVSAAGGV